MNTSSIAWPNMFDVSRNRVSVLEDNHSIVNRCRLLFLADTTELFNIPTFGAGLKRYLFHYNVENTKVIVQDRLKEQLREFEPCVKPDDTQFEDSLLFTGGSGDGVQRFIDNNTLEFTVGLVTIYGDELEVTANGN